MFRPEGIENADMMSGNIFRSTKNKIGSKKITPQNLAVWGVIENLAV